MSIANTEIAACSSTIWAQISTNIRTPIELCRSLYLKYHEAQYINRSMNVSPAQNKCGEVLPGGRTSPHLLLMLCRIRLRFMEYKFLRENDHSKAGNTGYICYKAAVDQKI